MPGCLARPPVASGNARPTLPLPDANQAGASSPSVFAAGRATGLRAEHPLAVVRGTDSPGAAGPAVGRPRTEPGTQPPDATSISVFPDACPVAICAMASAVPLSG